MVCWKKLNFSTFVWRISMCVFSPWCTQTYNHIYIICTHVCVADPCQSFSENAAYNACRMTILYSDLHWLLIASTGTGFSRKSMSVISRCGPDAVMLQWCCSDAGLAWVTAASIQYRYFPGIEKGAFALVYLCLVAPGLCLTLFRASS